MTKPDPVREALEPFARWINELDREFADHEDDIIAGGLENSAVTFGDLRRARAALASLPDNGWRLPRLAPPTEEPGE